MGGSERCVKISIWANHKLKYFQVIDSDISVMIKAMRASLDIRKTENACLQGTSIECWLSEAEWKSSILGLDPQNIGVIHFNKYIDWLGHMYYLYDSPPPLSSWCAGDLIFSSLSYLVVVAVFAVQSCLEFQFKNNKILKEYYELLGKIRLRSSYFGLRAD